MVRRHPRPHQSLGYGAGGVVRQVLVAERGQQHQQPGVHVVEAGGVRVRGARHVRQFPPGQARAGLVSVQGGQETVPVPLRMDDEVVGAGHVRDVTAHHHGRVPVPERHPERRPPLLVRERVEGRVDIGGVRSEPLRTRVAVLLVAPAQEHQVGGPEARQVQQVLPGDDRALVSVDHHADKPAGHH
ncbi:hypothetical protein [Streptomyces sp. NPDC101165]|uniref:hypothetical protein n=1 Tax=Streptomyces sp. NPDC101165 TaxID=3366119 RepID=UPI00380AA2EA